MVRGEKTSELDDHLWRADTLPVASIRSPAARCTHRGLFPCSPCIEEEIREADVNGWL
jgi:hypothetical protein